VLELITIRIVRLTFVLVVVASLLTVSVLWQNRPIDWSSERQVTNGVGDSRLVDIKGGSNGVVHLVWEDDREEKVDVYYKRSTDDGVTWGEDVKLTNLTPQTIEPIPRLVTSENVVLILFSNRTENGEHVFYVLSQDAGAHFSPPKQLSFASGDQSNAAASMVGKVIHVVWQGYLRGQAQTIYVKSPDGGLTWDDEVALKDSGLLDRHPSLYAVGDNVFVAWSRNDLGREAVFFRASYDSGETWEQEVQLSDFEPPIFLIFPSVASDGSAVHVIWNWKELYYARSMDAGKTWSPPTAITYGGEVHLAPEISAVGSQIQVVSAAFLTQGEPRRVGISADIQYLKSADGGDQWTEPLVLTEHESDVLSLAPAISIREGATFVAWQDNRKGGFAAYLISKPDFAAIHTYWQQLVYPLLFVLAATSIAYAALELKNRRRTPKRQRGARRTTRIRSRRKRVTRTA